MDNQQKLLRQAYEELGTLWEMRKQPLKYTEHEHKTQIQRAEFFKNRIIQENLHDEFLAYIKKQADEPENDLQQIIFRQTYHLIKKQRNEKKKIPKEIRILTDIIHESGTEQAFLLWIENERKRKHEKGK